MKVKYRIATVASMIMIVSVFAIGNSLKQEEINFSARQHVIHKKSHETTMAKFER